MKRIIFLFALCSILVNCSSNNDTTENNFNSLNPLNGTWKLIEYKDYELVETSVIVWESIPQEYQFTYKIQNTNIIESSIFTCNGIVDTNFEIENFEGDLVKIYFGCEKNSENPYTSDIGYFSYQITKDTLILTTLTDVANETRQFKFMKL